MFKGVNPGSLLVTIAMVIFIFGTQRVKTLGHDIVRAVRNLRNLRRGLKQEPEEELDYSEAEVIKAESPADSTKPPQK
ncbi:MAG TPA: hypothetical protein VJB02_03965 [Coxiellaceae bacterium]|nr:hypothetical protein [Coxiellaceae bacterium]